MDLLMNITKSPQIELSYHDILNTDKYNLWFAKNVAFLFSIGVGLDDQYNSYLRKLQENIFNIKSSSQVILLNKITIVDYSQLKDLEINTFGIYNGNYKLGLYVFVNDSADFTCARESLYNHAGLVANYYNADIFTYISSVITKYGLIRDVMLRKRRSPDPPKQESEEERTARMTRQNRDIVQKTIPMQMPNPKGRYLATIDSTATSNRLHARNLFTETTGQNVNVINIERKPLNPMPIVNNKPAFSGFSIFDVEVK